MARPAKAAALGSATPATRWLRRGSSVRGFSHTDIDISTSDAGQATALRSVPSLVVKMVEDEKRFAVSPMTFSVMPSARRIHGRFDRPESSTVDRESGVEGRRGGLGGR